MSAKVRPSRGDLLVVPKELLIQKESRELNVGSELAAPIYGNRIPVVVVLFLLKEGMNKVISHQMNARLG